uniref:Uncharacterized protein n=1 Tax=Oryza sativa subsp. japonica TaxID=39947 RepID=Q53JQ9_ORYSJ|nr:hypothetical protein LOC_Os11g26610 [Oryza sativa Japonica Group]
MAAAASMKGVNEGDRVEGNECSPGSSRLAHVRAASSKTMVIELLKCKLIIIQLISHSKKSQTTYKIRRDMLIGVKNKISFGELYYKPDHCVRTRGGFYCCELDQLCYPTLELCIPACTPSKDIDVFRSDEP